MNKLEELFREDKKDRKALEKNEIELDTVREKDVKRREKALNIIENKDKLSGKDYYMAATIFQHGDSIEDIKKAKKFAKKSIDKNYKDARWLYAASTDRLLFLKGEKQKFGTQYHKKDGEWELYPVDSNTTDKEREKYNVKPISNLKNPEGEPNSKIDETI